MNKYVPFEDRQKVVTAVEKTGKDHVSIVFSLANHSFNCHERSGYNDMASKEFMALTLALLESIKISYRRTNSSFNPKALMAYNLFTL